MKFNCNIGILGGTFDPAHYGHLEISKQAYKAIGLDQIWWIVSTRNPMKNKSLHPFDERIQKAKDITKHLPYIKIYKNDLNLKTNYTSELLEKIKNKNIRTNFVWIMGADNLIIFHKWYKFERIINNIPIIVIDRKSHRNKALKSQTAIKYSDNFVNSRNVKLVPYLQPPAWTYLDIKTLDISSTDIKKKILSS